jgi:hypothetical protein
MTTAGIVTTLEHTEGWFHGVSKYWQRKLAMALLYNKYRIPSLKESPCGQYIENIEKYPGKCYEWTAILADRFYQSFTIIVIADKNALLIPLQQQLPSPTSL